MYYFVFMTMIQKARIAESDEDVLMYIDDMTLWDSSSLDDNDILQNDLRLSTV
jgi:hypothetical protein